MYTKQEIQKAFEAHGLGASLCDSIISILDSNKHDMPWLVPIQAHNKIIDGVNTLCLSVISSGDMSKCINGNKMSNTIQHDYQYKGLMYASIAESKHFNDEVMDSGMRIFTLTDMEFIYIPAAKKSELIYRTPPKRGAIGRVLDLLSNIFNETK